jgi:hypothetical protein
VEVKAMNQKKYFLAVLIFVLIFSSPNYAQKLSVGAGGFYILKNPTIENGFGYQVNLLVKTQQRIAMLYSIGHHQEPGFDWQSLFATPYSFSDLTTAGNYLLDGDFTLTWFELSPLIDLFDNKSPKITFCAGVGLGLYYANNKWNQNTYHSLLLSQEQDSLYYHEKRIGPHFGINFRAAVNIPTTSKSFLSIEAKYIYYKPEIHYEINTPALSDTYYGDRKIDLSTLSINISLMLIL